MVSGTCCMAILPGDEKSSILAGHQVCRQNRFMQMYPDVTGIRPDCKPESAAS
jgi:hypothetical protein